MYFYILLLASQHLVCYWWTMPPSCFPKRVLCLLVCCWEGVIIESSSFLKSDRLLRFLYATGKAVAEWKRLLVVSPFSLIPTHHAAAFTASSSSALSASSLWPLSPSEIERLSETKQILQLPWKLDCITTCSLLPPHHSLPPSLLQFKHNSDWQLLYV